MSAATPSIDRTQWQGVKCTDLDDIRTQNILFWQRAGGAEIRAAAWDLVVKTGRPRSSTLMNSDFKDLLLLFARHEVRHLVIGGYPAIHATP